MTSFRRRRYIKGFRDKPYSEENFYLFYLSLGLKKKQTFFKTGFRSKVLEWKMIHQNYLEGLFIFLPENKKN